MAPRVAISSVLGFIAGYVDVICIVRYGAFAVTQTGNLIFIGSSLHAALFDYCKEGIDGPSADVHGCRATAIVQIAFSLSVMGSNLLGAYAYSALHHFHP